MDQPPRALLVRKARSAAAGGLCPALFLDEATRLDAWTGFFPGGGSGNENNRIAQQLELIFSCYGLHRQKLDLARQRIMKTVAILGSPGGTSFAARGFE